MRFLVFILLIVLLISPSCDERENFEITGHVKGIDSAIVYLGTKEYERLYEIDPIDSTFLENGRFEFKGSVKIPQRRYIKIQHKFGSIPLFVENSRISIKTTKRKYPAAEITGSITQNHYESYIKKEDEYNDSIRILDQAIQNAISKDNKEKANNLGKRYSKLYKAKIAFIKDYILSDAPSALRLYIYKKAWIVYPKPILDSLYQSLDSSAYNTEIAETLEKRILDLEKVQPGEPYINLTLKNISGKEVSLSDYVGKNYVLLYFVHLCPHIDLVPKGFKKLYQKYHDKGFQLFGVYTDSDPYYWKNTVRKHNLKWPFVSDLKSQNSEVYKKYGHLITTNYFLIDKDGKFIGKYITVEAIDKELEKIFGNKQTTKPNTRP
jgi:peroxiredoxin